MIDYVVFEEVLNNCLKKMQDNNILYMTNINKQNELVFKELGSHNIKIPDEYISIIANFIYTKKDRYNYLSVQLFNNYLKDYYNNYQYDYLLNLIEQVTLNKQENILRKACINTYLEFGYNKVIYAINNLINNKTYDGFSRYDVKNNNKQNSYRTILANNISSEEIINVMKTYLRKTSGGIKADYIRQYVNEITKVSQIYILNDVCTRVLNNSSKEDLIEALKKYISSSSIKSRMHAFETESNKNQKKMCLYVDCYYVVDLIKEYLQEDVLEIDELIDKYIDKISENNKHISIH